MSSQLDVIFSNTQQLYFPPLLDMTKSSGNDIAYITVNYTKAKVSPDANYSGIYDSSGNIITDPSFVAQAIIDNINQLNAGETNIAIMPVVNCSFYIESFDGTIYNRGSTTWGLPFFRFKKGQNFIIQFTNTTGFSYNIHWHGLNNTSDNDGASGEVEFGNDTYYGQTLTIFQSPITNPSSVIWYHAHPMFYSSALNFSGTFGLVDIVDDISYIVNDGLFSYGDNYLILYYADVELNSDGTLDKRNNYIDAWRSNYGIVNGTCAVCWYADIDETQNDIQKIQTMTSTNGQSWNPGCIIDASLNITGICYGEICICNVFGKCKCTLNDSGTCDCNSFVATTNDGKIYNSLDGTTWDLCIGNIPSGAIWSFVTSGVNDSSTYVVVASTGQIAFSQDAVTWKSATIPSDYSTTNWTGVTYGNYIYVAVGFQAPAIYSIDNGNTWRAGSGLDTTASWCGVQYGNGIYVTISSSISSEIYGKAAYSYDGVHWLSGNIPDSDINNTSDWCGITYGNGTFVAVAVNQYTILYSTDGINWTNASGQDESGKWADVVYGNNVFVAVSSTGIISYSNDGITWSAGNINQSGLTFSAIATAGEDNIFAAVSMNGMSAYSTDGIHWTVGSTIDSTVMWSSITNGPETDFIAFGTNGNAMYSEDGITWTNEKTINPTANWSFAVYGPNAVAGFIAVAATGQIIYSSNGVQWYQSTIPDGYVDVNWTGVTYGNGKYVAVGFGVQAIYSTDNGVTWSIGNGLDTTASWCGVQFGNAIFSAVSSCIVSGETTTPGKAAYSYDGINWVSGSIPNTETDNTANWCGITYGINSSGTDIFVCTALNGPILYSLDGITWQDAISITNSDGQPATGNWSDVVYGNNMFVTISSDGKAAYSTDGMNWSMTLGQATTFQWSAITYGMGNFIAVSNTGPLPTTNIHMFNCYHK
jgi:Multicopper oxidase